MYIIARQTTINAKQFQQIANNIAANHKSVKTVRKQTSLWSEDKLNNFRQVIPLKDWSTKTDRTGNCANDVIELTSSYQTVVDLKLKKWLLAGGADVRVENIMTPSSSSLTSLPLPLVMMTSQLRRVITTMHKTKGTLIESQRKTIHHLHSDAQNCRHANGCWCIDLLSRNNLKANTSAHSLQLRDCYIINLNI